MENQDLGVDPLCIGIYSFMPWNSYTVWRQMCRDPVFHQEQGWYTILIHQGLYSLPFWTWLSVIRECNLTREVTGRPWDSRWFWSDSSLTPVYDINDNSRARTCHHSLLSWAVVESWFFKIPTDNRHLVSQCPFKSYLTSTVFVALQTSIPLRSETVNFAIWPLVADYTDKKFNLTKCGMQ
jgi:hypothetical protein